MKFRSTTPEELYEDYLDEIEESEEEEEEAPAEEESEEETDDESSEELDPIAAADIAAAEATDDDAGDDDDELPPAEEETEQADAAGEEETESEGDVEPEEETEAAPQAQQPEQRQPVQYAQGTVEEVDTKLTELDDKIVDIETRRDELEDKWVDGDIADRSEYRRQQRELRAEERALQSSERELHKQKDRIERTQAEIEHNWRRDSAEFFRENPAFAENEDYLFMLERKIKAIASEPEIMARGNAAVLAEAKRRAEEVLNIKAPDVEKESSADKEKTPSPTEKAAAEKKALKGRGKKPALPKTLGGLPAADETDVTKDKYSSIDDLDGPEYEEAIANMTPTEYKKYMSSAH